MASGTIEVKLIKATSWAIGVFFNKVYNFNSTFLSPSLSAKCVLSLLCFSNFLLYRPLLTSVTLRFFNTVQLKHTVCSNLIDHG